MHWPVRITLLHIYVPCNFVVRLDFVDLSKMHCGLQYVIAVRVAKPHYYLNRLYAHTFQLRRHGLPWTPAQPELL